MGSCILDFVKAETPTVCVPVLWSLLVYSTHPRRFLTSPPSLSSHTTAGCQEEELFLDKPKPIWMPTSASKGKSRWETHIPVLHHHPARCKGRTWSKGVTKAFLAPIRSWSALTPHIPTNKLYVTVHRGGLWVNEQQVRPSRFLPPRSSKVGRQGLCVDGL